MKESSTFEMRNGQTPGNGGMTSRGCLFFLLFLTILGVGLFRVGGAYWEYYQVREQVREALTWAVAGQAKDELSISQRVLSRVNEETDLYLRPRNVLITQTADELTVRVFWTRDLDFWVYTYPLDLEVRLSEFKRWGGRGLVIK